MVGLSLHGIGERDERTGLGRRRSNRRVGRNFRDVAGGNGQQRPTL